MYIEPIAGLLEKLIHEAGAEKRRKHEKHMQMIAMIADSNLRDAYVHQLLLNQFFLSSCEKAQHKLQNAAKHAQWLAEMMTYYHQDHGATKEQGKEIAKQLRFLAIEITEVDSLEDLQAIYKATTLFVEHLSGFCHKERQYSLGRSLRKEILDSLNDCIETENNLRKRLALTPMEQNKNVELLKDTK